VFGRGALAEARELLAPGYTLLTTQRAGALAPDVLERAAAVHDVPAGRVDEVAGALRAHVRGQLFVALGGGRVIDVAKALAAADPPRTVAAIPTTLSGAEMTGGHRHAAGVSAGSPGVRPAIVINDPALSASQPLKQLARSAGNALGHAIEGPVTPLTNPVAALAGVGSVRLIAGWLMPDLDDEARDSLALGALLAGYVIGSTGYGLHHILSQTLARFAGVAHGTANTLMLPHTVAALAGRAPEWNARLERALGRAPSALAEHVRELAGLTGLRAEGVLEGQLETCVEQASQRPELAMTPPPASVDELRDLYRAAY
jgi:alcohol dehydrogenase class IV